jgi:hypothetical protein
MHNHAAGNTRLASTELSVGEIDSSEPANDEDEGALMNTATWIVQGVLAFALIGAGLMKLVKSREALLSSGPSMAWAEDFSDGTVKLIGLLEVAAAAGLVLPWALNLVPVLTPVAGIGVALLLLGAASVHLRRHENKAIGAPLLLAVLGAFVAVSRFGILGS